MKMLLTVAFGLSCVALSAFGASLTVTAPIGAGSAQMKPGEYKLEMQGDKLVFKSGKTVVAEVPAVSEAGAKKFGDTTYESKDGKITAIRVGGTNTRIVLK